MRVLTWLLRGVVFFVLFAFALNNMHLVEVQWFWGYKSQAPMVFIVLAVFGLGCIIGVLAMVPSWWRHRRDARQRLPLMPDKPVVQTPLPSPADSRSGHPTVPAGFPPPPDMPAPRQPRT